MSEDAHAIDVDLERILPILARAIYTSPFAFLRENVQNAFDAIRMQRHREGSGVARTRDFHSFGRESALDFGFRNRDV